MEGGVEEGLQYGSGPAHTTADNRSAGGRSVPILVPPTPFFWRWTSANKAPVHLHAYLADFSTEDCGALCDRW
jgi:hypothetical protein